MRLHKAPRIFLEYFEILKRFSKFILLENVQNVPEMFKIDFNVLNNGLKALNDLKVSGAKILDTRETETGIASKSVTFEVLRA